MSGKKRNVRTASAVPCYPRYFSGAPERVMIDNTHVVVLRGTGRDRIGTRLLKGTVEAVLTAG